MATIGVTTKPELTGGGTSPKAGTHAPMSLDQARKLVLADKARKLKARLRRKERLVEAKAIVAAN